MGNFDTIMRDIQDIKNWKKTNKKIYEVYMCCPEIGTECSNKLEGSSYVTNEEKQFILSGIADEQWVIDINTLAKTFVFSATEEPITEDRLRKRCNKFGQIDWVLLKTRPDVGINWAFFLPISIKNFPVQTSLGDTLYANRPGISHGKGDFLICADAGGMPNLNDMRVVNGEIFPKTYDLHAFPNMFDESITKVATPYPSKNFMTENKISLNSGGNKVFLLHF